ncbi:MAG: metalloregulator ArsR/SmtB family transcription factor [Bacillota bacterium]
MEKFCCEIAGRAQADMPSDIMLTDLADFFKIFGDGTRIKLLFALQDGRLCVHDLAIMLKMQQPAVSYQLKILRHYKVVKTQREGRKTFYSLDDGHILEILNTGLVHMQHGNDKLK